MSSSDLQGVRTNAKKDGDDWILNGSKVFITNGYMSGVVVVVAITNPEAKSTAHGISLFLVEDGMPGFKKGRKLDKIGLKAQVRLDVLWVFGWYLLCLVRYVATSSSLALMRQWGPSTGLVDLGGNSKLEIMQFRAHSFSTF